jgi:hypothetical protein
LYKTRVVPNKYRKFTETEEIRKLRSENRRILKENKRLRKELSKFIEQEFDEENINEDTPTLKVKELCPKCSSEDLVTVDLGIKQLTVCKQCKYRRTNK